MTAACLWAGTIEGRLHSKHNSSPSSSNIIEEERRRHTAEEDTTTTCNGPTLPPSPGYAPCNVCGLDPEDRVQKLDGAVSFLGQTESCCRFQAFGDEGHLPPDLCAAVQRMGPTLLGECQCGESSSQVPSLEPSAFPSLEPSSEPSLENDGFDVTAQQMFDSITQYMEVDSEETFDSISSKSFDYIFSCNGQVDEMLLASHNAAWNGFVEYANNVNNVIPAIDPDTGGTVLVDDPWGGNCDNVSWTSCGFNYLECPVVNGTSTCVPGVQNFQNEKIDIDIDIYEPCNYASNIAYYRAMPQMCPPEDTMYMSADNQKALLWSFGHLAYGSCFFHGSHTYLGHQGDTILIKLIAFLDHQLVISALSDQNPTVNTTSLYNLQDGPRKIDAVQSATAITEMFLTSPVNYWALEMGSLGLPDYELAFTIIIASDISAMLPEESYDQTVINLCTVLASIFGVNVDYVTENLPTLRELTRNLDLTDDEKFILFRQLIGMGGKMIYSFLWQERIFKVPLFLEPGPNKIGSILMKPLNYVFNSISAFQFSDEKYQEYEGVYPGEDFCRPTQPHSKWHEISSSGLSDLCYVADCYAAIVNGDIDQGCASLSSLDGMGEITLAEYKTWINQSFRGRPILKHVLSQYLLDCFYAIDHDSNDIINFADILYWFNAIVDWVNSLGNFINGFSTLINRIEESPVCIEDDQCADGESCIFFTCGLQEDGQPCVEDNHCVSGQCAFFSCGLQANGDQCYRNTDCESERCTGIPAGTCQAKLPSGSVCSTNADCESGDCQLRRFTCA